MSDQQNTKLFSDLYDMLQSCDKQSTWLLIATAEEQRSTPF